MSNVKTATSRLKIIALVGALIIAAATLTRVGSGTDEDCERRVSFTANWSNRGVRAKTVEWGPGGKTVTEGNVPPPWQRLNVRIPCGWSAVLRITFRLSGRPGEMLGAITANNEVHDVVPLDDERTVWSVSVNVI